MLGDTAAVDDDDDAVAAVVVIAATVCVVALALALLRLARLASATAEVFTFDTPLSAVGERVGKEGKESAKERMGHHR